MRELFELCFSAGEPTIDGHRTSWRLLFDVVQCMLQMGAWVVLALLSEIFKNLVLLRRPVAVASELEPLLEQARNCRDEASALLCTWDQYAMNEPLPSPLFELRATWESYLEEKVREWKGCTTIATFLSA